MPFTPLAMREPRVRCVRDAPPPVGEAVRLLEDELAAAIHPDDAGERRLGGERVELLLQVAHRAINRRIARDD